jgi:hypothetical protein
MKFGHCHNNVRRYCCDIKGCGHLRFNIIEQKTLITPFSLRDPLKHFNTKIAYQKILRYNLNTNHFKELFRFLANTYGCI